MRIRPLGLATMVILAGLFSLSASACNFYFNYEAIEAPIGTVGEIGIQVQKTHNRCTLPSMDEYAIDATGIQVLGETEWEDKGSGVYEKWVQVSLSELGQGALTISKTCTKEGYEEKVLPIVSVAAVGEDSPWVQAWNGTYPFETTVPVGQSHGSPFVENGMLTVGEVSIALPMDVVLPESLPDDARLYTQQIDEHRVPLLLVGESLFIRFDQVLP